MKRIFFTVSNAPGTVYRIKSFQEKGYEVVAGDANPNAIGRHFADIFYVLPYQATPEYVDFLLEIIKKEKIDILIADEAESLLLHGNKTKIESLGCTLVATDINTLNKSLDKIILFNFLKKNTDIPLPGFFEVNSVVDFDKGLSELGNENICIKPAIASGSRGFVILTQQPMEAKTLFSKKMGFFEIATDQFRKIISASPNIPKLIMMEYLQDINYDSNMVCKNGNILFQSVKTRGEAKIGTITQGQIVENDEIKLINIKIAKALGTTGLVSPQFIGNKLIEINPRWSTSLNYKSINEYLFGVQVFTGEKINIDPDDYRDYVGLKMTRYWDVITYK
ncbi:MAG TPA: hypothetical protein VMW28_00295 [Pelolinea sp.]|nr:hypothetical protein [Pelolinea sp.]